MHVGLADEDRAGAAQQSGDRRVGVGQPIAEHLAAGGRARAAQGDVVLQRDLDPVQRPEVVPGREHDLGRLGNLQRLLLEHRDVGTQQAVGGADACQRSLYQFDGRKLPGADAACRVGEAQVQQLVVADHDASSPASAVSAGCVSTVIGSSVW